MVSYSAVISVLSSMRFPATRDDIISHLSSELPDVDLIRRANMVPVGEYGSIADVLKGLGHTFS